MSTQRMDDLSLEAARERILAACAPLDTIIVDAFAAAGDVLAADVVAPHDLPPFANAGMDGFAVRVADLAGASHAAPIALRVAAVAQAGGTTQAPVMPGCAVRIMTGAPLPLGAEAVVPLELVEATETEARFVEPVRAGWHIRLAGEDIKAGSIAIPAGQLVRAAEIGLLAALGIAQVAVTRRPRVAIISTGDELVDARFGPEPLAAGAIRDANGPALATFVSDQGGQPLRLGIARDTHAALRNKLDAAERAGADLILTSAGASAGDYDIVSGWMRDTDSLELWRINIKPGRSLVFGRVGARHTPLLGLPGNPGAALVVAELLLKPALARMRGLVNEAPVRVLASLDAPQYGSQRRHYLRAHIAWTPRGYVATTRGIGTGSGSLATLVRANALLVIPEHSGELAAGALVEAILL